MTNRIQDAFDNIKADTRLKESTKQFLSERSRANRIPHHRPAIKYMVSVACAMLFLITGALGYSLVQTPVSYISIDINPSIELALNRFDRVVSARAYNTEGEEILNGLSLTWKKYTEAIDSVMACDNMQTYLTDQEELLIAVSAGQNQELERGVRRCSGHMGRNCHNVSVDQDSAAQAHHKDISIGKYYAYQQLSQYDSSITIDDCRNMSMAQIQQILDGYKQDEKSKDSKNTEKYTENACGNCSQKHSCGKNNNDTPSHQKRRRHRRQGHH